MSSATEMSEVAVPSRHVLPDFSSPGERLAQLSTTQSSCPIDTPPSQDANSQDDPNEYFDDTATRLAKTPGVQVSRVSPVESLFNSRSRDTAVNTPKTNVTAKLANTTEPIDPLHLDKRNAPFDSYDSNFHQVFEDEGVYLDYTTLLQLPDFEAYEYPTKVISEAENETAHDKQTAHGSRASAKSSGGRNSDILEFAKSYSQNYGSMPKETETFSDSEAAGNITKLDDGMLFDLRLRLISPLKNIFHKGDELLRGTLKVEDAYRQLAEGRRVMGDDIHNLADISLEDQMKSEPHRLAVLKSQNSLKTALRRLEEEEKNLIVQQRTATRLHGELKETLNILHEALLDGRQLGDTQAAEEEEFLNGRGPLRDLDVPTIVNEAGAGENADYFVDASEISEYRDIPGIRTLADDIPSINLGNMLTPIFMAPHHLAQPQASIGKNKRNKLITSRFATDLAFSGSALTYAYDGYDDCDILLVSDPSRTASISDTPDLVRSIRETDLAPELSIDSNSISPTISSRRTMQQKYHESKIARLHREDWTTMWGSSMSYNAFSDLLRTILYDTPVDGEHHPTLWAILDLKDFIKNKGSSQIEREYFRVKYWADTIRGIDLNTRPISLPSQMWPLGQSVQVQPNGSDTNSRMKSPEATLLRVFSSDGLIKDLRSSTEHSRETLSPRNSMTLPNPSPEEQPRALQNADVGVQESKESYMANYLRDQMSTPSSIQQRRSFSSTQRRNGSSNDQLQNSRGRTRSISRSGI